MSSSPDISVKTQPDSAPQVSGQFVSKALELRFGGYSHAGVKERNDDAFAAHLPSSKYARQMKGAVACIADGISVSDRSHLASQLSVTQFIDDYLATPEGWSVEESASKVLKALNDWLSGQSRNNQTSAMVTTFSAAVIKSKSVHIFHVGDSRIYRLRGGQLTQITRDHCMNFAKENVVLTAALGMDARLSVDYSRIDAEVGDVLLLTTDGVSNVLRTDALGALLESKIAQSNTLDAAAQAICDEALSLGSDDNITCGIVAIDSLPQENMDEAFRRVQSQKIPPVLQPGNKIDGLEVMSVIHSGTRSHIYKVRSLSSDETFVLKAPSANFANDAVYLDGFIREQWVGRRLNHPGIMQVHASPEETPFLYLLCESIEGQTLRDWMTENPKPVLAEVRNILREIIHALRAMHRMGMVHRDIKPENIMLTHQGQIKIIDFGTVQVAGMNDNSSPIKEEHAVGSVNYSAPEMVLQNMATTQADIFSLGVITYEMLAGVRPYKDQSGANKRPNSLADWNYKNLRNLRGDVPLWVNHALKTACAPNLSRRYPVMSEFLEDMTRPSTKAVQAETQTALIERNPVAFWKGLSGCLLIIILILIGLMVQTSAT